MKILQLCGKDFFGAGRAAYRLHKGLLERGVDSKMWVGAKRTHDNTVVDIHHKWWQKKLTKVYVRLEKIKVRLFAGGSKEMFSLGHPAHCIRELIEKEQPDIVHLHWINRGFANLEEFRNLKIPVVITLHDMWWYTGGCHYDEDCGKYVLGCGECPVLKKNNLRGLSFWELKKKREVLNSNPSVTFVGLSSWMTDCVGKSLIGQDHKIVHLPNGIDINKFAPKNKNECRKKLKLPSDRKLVLFAAVDVLSETRKGYTYVRKALGLLDTSEYELVVIGEKGREESVSGLKTYFLGEIDDDQLMIEYISAVDVAVVPSLQENLSNLIMESLACATPVVAFDIGGNGDMIAHKKNGYLAKDKNTEDLVVGIRFCCEENHAEGLANQARKTVEDNFDITNVSDKYIKLYRSLK